MCSTPPTVSRCLPLRREQAKGERVGERARRASEREASERASKARASEGRASEGRASEQGASERSSNDASVRAHAPPTASTAHRLRRERAKRANYIHTYRASERAIAKASGRSELATYRTMYCTHTNDYGTVTVSANWLPYDRIHLNTVAGTYYCKTNGIAP